MCYLNLIPNVWKSYFILLLYIYILHTLISNTILIYTLYTILMLYSFTLIYIILTYTILNIISILTITYIYTIQLYNILNT